MQHAFLQYGSTFATVALIAAYTHGGGWLKQCKDYIYQNCVFASRTLQSQVTLRLTLTVARIDRIFFFKTMLAFSKLKTEICRSLGSGVLSPRPAICFGWTAPVWGYQPPSCHTRCLPTLKCCSSVEISLKSHWVMKAMGSSWEVGRVMETRTEGPT